MSAYFCTTPATVAAAAVRKRLTTRSDQNLVALQAIQTARKQQQSFEMCNSTIIAWQRAVTQQLATLIWLRQHLIWMHTYISTFLSSSSFSSLSRLWLQTACPAQWCPASSLFLRADNCALSRVQGASGLNLGYKTYFSVVIAVYNQCNFVLFLSDIFVYTFVHTR